MKVNNNLIDKCTELCLSISHAPSMMVYAEVWEWFLTNYLGVKHVSQFNKNDFTHEEWLAAYDKLYADLKKRGLV